MHSSSMGIWQTETDTFPGVFSYGNPPKKSRRTPKKSREDREETEGKIFTESEVKTLLSSAVFAGATDAQCLRLVRWAERTQIYSVMLAVILSGKALVKVTRNGSPVFVCERSDNNTGENG
jgi:hypothetical protein